MRTDLAVASTPGGGGVCISGYTLSRPLKGPYPPSPKDLVSGIPHPRTRGQTPVKTSLSRNFVGGCFPCFKVCARHAIKQLILTSP